MRTIIAGSREGFTYDDVIKAVRASGWEDAISEVVSGGARGPDTWGEQWAQGRKIPVRRLPADWQRHGKAAGPIRNRQMAQYAEALIAVWDGKSRGTAHMIEEARQRGLKVYVWELEAKPTQQEMPL